MHGYQFYEDVERPHGSAAGEIIAVRLNEQRFVQEGGVCYPALQSKPEPESGTDRVLSTFFNVEYLGAHCVPVSEERAREINPILFKYLDGLA